MDLLSRAVDELGLRRTSFRQFMVGPEPWALGYAAGVQGVHVVAAGTCEFVLGRTREPLEAGDLVIVPRGSAHQLRAPGLPLRAHAVPAAQLVQRGPGPIVVGGGPASCQLVCGTLEFEAKDHPMLAAVGNTLLLKGARARSARKVSALVAALVDEVEHARSGSEAVITRMAEVLFIEALRECAVSSECPTRGWFRGLEDPALGRALSAFHADIAAPWSVASLAKAAGQSRAAFARRFSAVLHESPLAYARRWRLFHARRLLRTTTASLDEVASRVGYGSAAALSLAFSRDAGQSPGAYRAAHHAAQAPLEQA
jgi:AraC-like DNA-binding protein